MWMNIAATQYLLGVRTTLDGLKLDPCIPSDWREYKVQRDYLGCRVNITFENPLGVSSGVDHIIIDDIKYEENILPRSIFEGRKEIDIRVLMGKM